MEVERVLKLIGHGKTNIGEKQFSLKDSIQAVTPSFLGLPDDWYGGLIKRLYKTTDGFYICADKKESLVNIAYDEEKLTVNGLMLLSEAGLYDIPTDLEEESPEDGEPPKDESTEKEPLEIDTMKRQELIDKAQQLGIEGKIATFKTEELREKIKAAL